MGLTGLDDCRGRESQLPISPEEQAALRERIEAGPTDEDQVCSLRGKDFQRVLAQEFGVMRSLPAVYRLLHRLGYSYLRPRPRHRKADSQVIEAFKLSWPEQIKAIAKEHPGKRLRVYFQGDSRFGQQGTTTNVWAERGSRPTAVRQTEYQYLWVLRAVCPEKGPRRGAAQPAVEYEDREHLP